MTMPKRTITAIAERVGVSVATVSRALNNQPGVSEDRRKEIVRIASEMKYFPNAIARSLQGQRTNTVAYLVEVGERIDADLFFFKDFITALAEGCARNGQDLLLHPVTTGASDMEDSGRPVRSGRADGVLLADVRQNDQRIQALSGQNVPFVAFGRDISQRHAWVDVDGEAGMALAVRHLIDRGHRRIAYLGLPEEYSCARHRYAGYERALQRSGIALDPGLLAGGLTDEQTTRDAVLRILLQENPPTAFVAASDNIALRAMAVLAQRGLRAGADYAITGFDDGPMATHTPPGLTTVRQSLNKVCDALIQMLSQITSKTPGSRSLLLTPELVVRGTTR